MQPVKLWHIITTWRSACGREGLARAQFEHIAGELEGIRASHWAS